MTDVKTVRENVSVSAVMKTHNGQSMARVFHAQNSIAKRRMNGIVSIESSRQSNAPRATRMFDVMNNARGDWAYQYQKFVRQSSAVEKCVRLACFR